MKKIITILNCFILKLLDCILSTSKTIFLVKNKILISAIMNSISAVLFIFVADLMSNSAVDIKPFIASAIFLANFLGAYLPPKIIAKIDKDKLFIFNITAIDRQAGIYLADSLRTFNIPVSTKTVYTNISNKTIECRAFAVSKDKSKIVMDCLNNPKYKQQFKYHITEAK